MSEREKAQAAIDILSGLILSGLRALGSEQHQPGVDVDASDALMRDREAQVRELRSIRERLENLFMRVVT